MFASRNPADYQITGAETCGTVGTAGNGCNPLFNIANNASSSGAGIMGYGVIDGRGEDKLLVNGTASTSSWWDIASQAQTSMAQSKQCRDVGGQQSVKLYALQDHLQEFADVSCDLEESRPGLRYGE